jgi:uncharacterized membrane protein YfcA
MDYLIGFGIAVLIALSGVGAGVITAPMLILFLHVPVEVAVSTALAYSAIVKLIVVPVQVARRQVNWRVLGVMLLGGLPGVILGSVLFKHVALHGPKAALYFVLGAIIIFTSGWHLFRHFKPAAIKRPGEPGSVDEPFRTKTIAGIMFPIGAEVGFSSSGAGALGTVALLSLTSLTAAQVVGTDLAFGLCIALVGTVCRSVALEDGHWRSGRRHRGQRSGTEDPQPQAALCPVALADGHRLPVLLAGGDQVVPEEEESKSKIRSKPFSTSLQRTGRDHVRLDFAFCLWGSLSCARGNGICAGQWNGSAAASGTHVSECRRHNGAW